jgi:hypothetical protein
MIGGLRYADSDTEVEFPTVADGRRLEQGLKPHPPAAERAQNATQHIGAQASGLGCVLENAGRDLFKTPVAGWGVRADEAGRQDILCQRATQTVAPFDRQSAAGQIQRRGRPPLARASHMLRHACGFALADQGADTR